MSNRLYKVLMRCGHSANSTIKIDGYERPYCVMCDCAIVELEQNELKNRIAICYCGKVVDSRVNLPFFRHRPHLQYDEFYCGCGGWD